MLRRVVRFISLLRQRHDPDAQFALLTEIGKRVMPGYRFHWFQLDWWNDAEFNAYLARFEEQHSFNADRRWMVYQLLQLVQQVPGDTAECGVWKGAGSYLICQANAKSPFPRHHHMFDSFEGLSQPAAEDGSYWQAGSMSAPFDLAQQNLREFSEVSFYKGWIPARFDEIADRTFAFVHVDVDLYEPTRDSIAFFYPRLSSGAILVCDDYGFTSCPGATKAIDDFLQDKPERMTGFSAGGGFFIKA